MADRMFPGRSAPLTSSRPSPRWRRQLPKNLPPDAHDISEQESAADLFEVVLYGREPRLALFESNVSKTDGAGFEVVAPRTIVIDALFDDGAYAPKLPPTNQAPRLGDPCRIAQLDDAR